jgi:hypothetical protein
MTPADEALFIQLWQQGVDSAAIGQQLGIPRGTVSSRAATLVRQGKIQPRPRGGAYPKQKALARLSPDGASPPTPPTTPTTPAPPAPQVAPATSAVTFVAVEEQTMRPQELGRVTHEDVPHVVRLASSCE